MVSAIFVLCSFFIEKMIFLQKVQNMKRFMILSALFVSVLLVTGCGEEKKQTYEENIKRRMEYGKNGYAFVEYDENVDTLLSNAALKHFGRGFDYSIEDMAIHPQPYYEDIDTVYVYLNTYPTLDAEYDTVPVYVARINDKYPTLYKYIKMLERTKKKYVDTTDVVAMVYSYNKIFDNVTKTSNTERLHFLITVSDNDVIVYDYDYSKPSNLSFYREENEYREIK